MPECGTFVRACQDYFSEEPHGRKVQIPEFKSLTIKDKQELSTMLNDAGYNHEPYQAPAA